MCAGHVKKCCLYIYIKYMLVPWQCSWTCNAKFYSVLFSVECLAGNNLPKAHKKRNKSKFLTNISKDLIKWKDSKLLYFSLISLGVGEKRFCFLALMVRKLHSLHPWLDLKLLLSIWAFLKATAGNKIILYLGRPLKIIASWCRYSVSLKQMRCPLPSQCRTKSLHYNHFLFL